MVVRDSSGLGAPADDSVAEGQILFDAVDVCGRDKLVFPQGPSAIGVFALEQIALAGAAAHHFAGTGDLESLGHGLSCFDSLGSSHRFFF
jgi:hypothetical protein